MTASAAVISGDVIKLDLGIAGDADGTPGATDDWNQVAGSDNITIGAGSVIRHGDAAVVDGMAINVNTTGNPGQANDASAAGWSGLSGDPYYNDEAFTDLAYGWGPGNLTVTFGGLDPILTYNVRTYALIDEGSADINLEVTDGASSITRSNLNRIALYNTASLSPDLIFEGVTPDGSGSIVLTAGSDAGVSFQAVVLEVAGSAPSLLLEVDYDPVSGKLIFAWNSRPGMVYDLLSNTTLTNDLAGWPVVAGAAGAISDTHTMDLPADDCRFYALRERNDTVEVSVMVDTATPAKAYDPMIFGGFFEHFGKQIYGGVFEPGSPLADADGFRTDVIAALNELNVPVIRWPGGCYVDDYDWLDGVGSNRQTTIDQVWGVWDSHLFGTDEFIELCRRLNAEPYICQNGLAGIQEMKDWVEYCNSTEGEFADMRIENGHTEPYNVKYWSVGNEMAGTSYYNTVRDAARGMKEVDPTIEVTCSGSHNGSHVDSELLTIAGDDLDLISIHQYAIANFQTHHTPDYLSAISLSELPKNYIEMILSDLTTLGYRDQIKITFDEWNMRSWHHPGFPNYSLTPQNPDDPAIIAQVAQRDLSLDPTLYTMADALYAASVFNACLRNADDVVMANVAPLVNQTGPLYVHPDGLVKRTHFHTFAMYAQYLKSKVVDSQVSSPILAGTSVSLVDAIVTTDDNLSYVLAIVNRDPSLPATCRVDIPGFALDGVFNAAILQGDSPDAFNNIDNPDRVAPEEVQLQFVNGVASLPPHSLTIVHLGN